MVLVGAPARGSAAAREVGEVEQAAAYHEHPDRHHHAHEPHAELGCEPPDDVAAAFSWRSTFAAARVEGLVDSRRRSVVGVGCVVGASDAPTGASVVVAPALDAALDDPLPRVSDDVDERLGTTGGAAVGEMGGAVTAGGAVPGGFGVVAGGRVVGDVVGGAVGGAVGGEVGFGTVGST